MLNAASWYSQLDNHCEAATNAKYSTIITTMAATKLVEHHNYPASPEICLENAKERRTHYFRVYNLGEYTTETTYKTKSKWLILTTTRWVIGQQKLLKK